MSKQESRLYLIQKKKFNLMYVQQKLQWWDFHLRPV